MSAYEAIIERSAINQVILWYLQVPPHTIDINIHPTKTEIKFDDEIIRYMLFCVRLLSIV